MMVDNVYILDNGAHTAKVELSKAAAPRIIPNCIMKAKSERRRPFIADQVEECRDASGLFYLLPFQKGFLINWDVQKTVWDYIFSKECCYGNFSETPLIVTEPYFNFPSIQEAMTEIFFEEYECQSLLRVNANCEVKEELEHLIEVLQIHDDSNGSLDFLESESYILRYISHKLTHEEDLKRILWEQNHNPMLQQGLCSNQFVKGGECCKQLWGTIVHNLPDENLLSQLDLIPSLHSCLHIKHKKQKSFFVLAEFNNEILLEPERVNNHHPDNSGTDHMFLNCDVTFKSFLSHDATKTCPKKHNAESLIERITLNEFSDSNDQPINYSLKYFEQEAPPTLDNLEQPINFSLKYLEEMDNESSECVEMTMFGAGETCYAETDLDEPPDMFFSYFESENTRGCSEGSGFNHLNTYPLYFSEEVKEYHVEGTPCDYSVVTSLSGICSPPFVEEAKVEVEIASPNLEVDCPEPTQAEVISKQNEGIVLETPLMFSRCSSVSSLTSVEQLDDVRSVVSEYSRMASGMISPSDLPDSPTQTTAPVGLNLKFHTPQKLRSVFEEEVSVFREESTPVQFSTTSSLSALSFDDNQLVEAHSDIKFCNQSAVTSEAASTVEKDDEDILAACISAGMQNGINGSVRFKKSRKSENSKNVSGFLNLIRSSQKDVQKTHLTSPESKNEVLNYVTKPLTSDDTPSSTSLSTYHSKTPEDSDHTDILAECIQAGMPKAWGKSKCNGKRTAKISLKQPAQKDASVQSPSVQKPSHPLDIKKTNSGTLPTLKTNSTIKVDHHNLVTPESSSPLESNTDVKLELSRRSSIDSIKEDSTEDAVTLSELLLLEQCITSGMPKKKTR